MANRDFALINKLPPDALEQNIQNGDYTFVLSDAGKLISKQAGGAGETFTIPPNTSINAFASFDSSAFDVNAFSESAFSTTEEEEAGFDIGTLIAIDNSGGGALTVAITTDTLIWANDATTGSRTLADDGLAVILKVADTIWKITGNGLS